jgi:hypothetical protein
MPNEIMLKLKELRDVLKDVKAKLKDSPYKYIADKIENL